MRSGSLVAMLVAALLAGCADGGDADADTIKQAVQTVDVQATSTTGVIRGVVVDTSITPVAGVTVTIASLNRTAVTTEVGAFGFEDLEPGTYFLQATHPDYTTVQQSVEVVAGVQQPDAVRIQVEFIPRGEPTIEALQSVIFISGAGWVAGSGVTAGGFGVMDGNYFFRQAITPGGTVAQTEVVWEMTTPLGETARVQGGTTEDGDGIDTETWYGQSPLAMRANATEGDRSADNVTYSFWAYDSAGLPGGLQVNQKVDAYIHVFYNFLPNEGWVFARDGPHPIPPK